MKIIIAVIILIVIVISGCSDRGEIKTIAFWPFDEQQGLYPSCVLSDHSENDFPLVLGPGGSIVKGKFGNALQAIKQPEIILPQSTSTVFGMVPIPIPEGRTVEPMNWSNAMFCALMTSGEIHLRKEVGFRQPTITKLNLGNFNWTIEFWFNPTGKTGADGVVFEIGQGPRGENDFVTRLSLDANLQHFILYNQPSQSFTKIPTKLVMQVWQHLVFTYDAEREQIKHFINGEMQPLPTRAMMKSLMPGDEDYMSIGCDGSWDHPLPGKIDELRFSEGIVYPTNFDLPTSFSYLYDESIVETPLKKGEPLIFADEKKIPITLGTRKHLFIDDALITEKGEASFVVNPPKRAERVISNIRGAFRKHLNVIEDEDRLLRMYNAVSDDYLAVRVSKDGINWDIPQLPAGKYKEHSNIVIHDPTGMGQVFIDPNAKPDERWKYISGFHDRGIFLYTSADGYHFKRKKTAVLPFWAGSQSNIFYDEQQQKYFSYHRADFARGKGGATQREFVMTETKNLVRPWHFEPSTQAEGLALAKRRRIKDLLPFYLDNGLLTPGGFAFEYPNVFKPIDGFDPIDTDLYVPKAIKYEWAPDVYLAFPVMYFHYKRSSPQTRSILWDKKYQRGSGPLETQLAVSRNAKKWHRYPRPTYIGIGLHEGRDIHTAYMAQGMIRRDDEIWQYYFGETQYHSTHVNDPEGRGVYRLIQRLDGFVSLDSPYESETYVLTTPIIFEGNRLILNIDTDATGYTQVGFIDEKGHDIEGFSVDECIYINGDFIEVEVEWLNKGVDISEMQGRVVRIKFRMRGSKLYAMQFINRDI